MSKQGESNVKCPICGEGFLAYEEPILPSGNPHLGNYDPGDPGDVWCTNDSCATNDNMDDETWEYFTRLVSEYLASIEPEYNPEDYE